MVTSLLTESLQAISSLDGRYAKKVSELSPYISEKALIEARLRVEALWLLHLDRNIDADHGLQLSESLRSVLTNIGKAPKEDAAHKVKEFEQTTNHDVKACEYYLKERLKESGASNQTLSYIHFACTSEDINNLAYGLMLNEARKYVILPMIDRVIEDLKGKALTYKNLAMLSRTHGQPASPTTLGKEISVFYTRLKKIRDRFESLKIEGKINGAVGNYNAHVVAFPNLDWQSISKTFISSLDLHFNPVTTQIESHDSMIDFSETLRKINTILIGFSRDIWSYISLGYFNQKAIPGEIGSSTMPHKINPIDFENAEGNYGIANALSIHFSEKLAISRMQRDLSDSTVQRALGTFLGHTLLAHKSLLKGLGKIEANAKVIGRDLESSIEVLAEPIQTVLRRYGVHDAYERLKEATRGQAVTRESLNHLINSSSELPEYQKQRLRDLTPTSYIGLASELVDQYVE